MHDPSPIRCTSRAAVVRAVAAGAVFSLLLSSCMVGPNFRSPAAPAVQGYTEAPLPPLTAEVPGIPGGVAQRFVPGGDIAAQWWSLFRSEPLDRLVRRALDESPTLAAAEAALRQSRENLLAARGALLVPNVDASVSAAREKSALAGPSAGVFNLYNASVNVSYALDVFGGNRRELEEPAIARSTTRASSCSAAHLALTSNIVTAAVREASVRAQIAATDDIIARPGEAARSRQRQYQLGAVARLNVLSLQLAGRADARDAAAARAPARRRRAISSPCSAAARPADAELPEFELDALTLPQDLPVSLPSAAGAPAARHSRGGSAAASGQRADRRRHREPVSEHHAVGECGPAGAGSSIACSTARASYGASAPACCSRCFTAASSRRGDALRSRLTIRRRRSTARPCCWRSRTSRTRCARSRPTRAR